MKIKQDTIGHYIYALVPVNVGCLVWTGINFDSNMDE